MSGLLLYIQANPLVGTSPLLRSLDLARQWKSSGGDVYYVVGQLPAMLLRKLAVVGCEVIKPSRPQAPDELAKTLWQFAEERKCDWLATDDSRPDLLRAVSQTRPEIRNVLVLGNPTRESAAGITLASGDDPSFVLLRPNHSNQPMPKVAARRTTRRVIVDLSRMDGDQAAEFVRRLCKRFQTAKHFFDIVTPFATAAANQLHEQMHPIRERITWHRNADRVFNALYCFDLAVTSDPAGFFETANCGLPSILLGANHENDSTERISNRLNSLVNLTTLPWWFDLSKAEESWPDTICKQIERLCGSPKMLATHSKEMSRLVDDHGAMRLTSAMKNLAEERAGKVKSA